MARLALTTVSQAQATPRRATPRSFSDRRLSIRIVRVHQQGAYLRLWDQLGQQLETLGHQLGEHGSDAGEVATATTDWALGNDFDWRTFDFDHDVDTVDDALAAILNANTADLEEFRSHGGKLLLWQGFADPRVPVLNTIAYYERLIASQMPKGRHDAAARKEALRRTQGFARLFLAPGVGHCGGGAGPDTFDAGTPITQWVQQGIAPDQIIASKVVNGVTTFSRPLCPYPALPRYSGVGDPTQASSFKCVADDDHDDNQPPAPKYLNDGDNYPIVPIDDGDHGHDHDNR